MALDEVEAHLGVVRLRTDRARHVAYGALLAGQRTVLALDDQAALKDPTVAKRMHELNFTDLPLATPEQFKATVAKDLQDWTALIKSIGLTLD